MYTDIYGFSGSEIGYLLSADMIGATVASFSARYWIDRLRWRPVLATALAVFVSTNALSAVTDSFALLLTLRAIAGLAAGSAMALVYAAFACDEQPDRQFAFALGTQVAVGATALLIAPHLLAAYGPASLFWLPAIATALPVLWYRYCPATNPCKPDALDVARRISGQDIAALASVVLMFLALTAVWVVAERLGSERAESNSLVAAALASGMLFSFLGSLAPAMTAGLAGRYLHLFGGYAVLLLAIIGMNVGAGVITYVVGLCIYNFFFSYLIPFQTAWIATSDGGARNAVLVPVAQGIGLSLGPAIAGHAIEAGGSTQVIVVSVVLLAASATIVIMVSIKK